MNDISSESTAHWSLFPGLARIDPDRSTAPFWEAARQHRLVAQRSAACGRFRHPPAPFCAACRSDADEWVDLRGTGTVYSFTVVEYAASPDIRPQDLPYVVVVVELDGTDGNKHISNLVGPEATDVAIGMAVRVVWDDIDDPEVTVPRFVRADQVDRR